MHPIVLSWLIGGLLWFALRRTYLRFGFSRLLQVVNRTDCYPCRVICWESGRIEVLEGQALLDSETWDDDDCLSDSHV